MYFRKTLRSLLLTVFLASCAPATAQPVPFPSYDPFMPIAQNSPVPATSLSTVTSSSIPPTETATITPTRPPTPTRVPLTVSPVVISAMAELVSTPTPDEERVLPTPRQEATQYTVQPGDSLGVIAEQYGISVQSILQANNIQNPDVLEVGMVLNIPAPSPGAAGGAFKIIPDSEMVNGPSAVYFDIKSFIDSQNGYLETYEQDVNGIVLSGDEIVYIVSRNYSVHPRLLLALLEYQSGWVTNRNPYNTDYPMGLLDANHWGLYRQLTWAANTLNRGYYLWRANAISTVVLNDGSVAPLDPTINAGTAAIQYFFSELDDRATWEKDSSPTGLLLTYYVFFGNPFDYAIEPLVPANLVQPPMALPFAPGQTWYFTGGPHGGWDSGSAWAALDFAPPGDNGGCLASPLWVTAVADGLVLRYSNGGLIQDLDNDGYEQTGWVILYMHIASDGSADPLDYLYTGDRVGHPSCEGGISNATHVHIARKYNGEWIAADGFLPYNLDGWISSGGSKEYDGFLTKGNVTIEAWDSASDQNQITH